MKKNLITFVVYAFERARRLATLGGVAHYAAIAAIALLTACSSDDNTAEEPTTQTGQETEAVEYTVSIPATIGDTDGTRAVSLNDETGGLDATFQTTDGIFVYDKTTDCYSTDNVDCTFMLLHPDKNGSKANLTGTARFYARNGQGRRDPAVGHELMLIYGVRYNGIGDNPTKTHFIYTGQPGTLAGLSSYDFATADVTIESIEGSISSGFTLTTTNADFHNQQSMFKLTLNGLDVDGDAIASVTVHSEKNKLVQTYNPATDAATYGDLSITLNDAARTANGAGIAYAALRFDALDEEEQDRITFTVTGTSGIPYVATKKTPKGGFQRGKFYRTTVSLVRKGPDFNGFNTEEVW